MNKDKPKTHTNTFYRPDIDGLRAIAVSLVIFFHTFPTVLQGGFIGVDIFFVISGYLIGSIILRNLSLNNFSFLQFYVRRIVRIFPVLLIVLCTVLIAGKILLIKDEYQMLGKHIAGGASFIANIMYFFEAGYWDTASALKPLLHLWSLGVEEQFYITIPLILAFVWKQKNNILLIICVLFLLSFATNLFFYYQKQQELIFYMPFTRFWEIFAGVLLACHTIFPNQFLQNRGKKIHHFFVKICKRDLLEDKQLLYNFLALAGFVLLIVSLQICRQYKFPGHRAVWPVLGTVLIIGAGSSAWLNKKILSHKILVVIGLISYPLYLWHWPLLSFCRILNGELLPQNEWIFIRILCIVCALILAVLSYCYVEKPIRFGKNNKNIIAGVLAILMFSIFMTGIYSYYRGTPVSLCKFNTIIERKISIDNAISEYDPEASKLVPAAYFQNAHSDKTIAVIGDSHAFSAFPGISKKCAELKINSVLFSMNAGDIVKYYDNPNNKPNQLPFLNILQSKTDIKYVFIFLRGLAYIQDHYEDSGFYPYGRIEDCQSQLQEIVNVLQSHKKHVFIVSENPVFPFAPQDFFRNYSFILKEPWISKESAYENQKEYLSMLTKIKGAEIINGLDVFCPHNKCSLFDENNNSLYLDENHLCNHGSEYLTKNLLAPYLERIAKEE